MLSFSTSCFKTVCQLSAKIGFLLVWVSKNRITLRDCICTSGYLVKSAPWISSRKMNVGKKWAWKTHSYRTPLTVSIVCFSISSNLLYHLLLLFLIWRCRYWDICLCYSSRFRATLYPCPETNQERQEMFNGVTTRLDDLNIVSTSAI